MKSLTHQITKDLVEPSILKSELRASRLAHSRASSTGPMKEVS